jgi:hypothetical protein
MYTCPVLHFTPEMRAALRWFDATHRADVGQTGIRLVRTDLLGDSILTVDARLYDVLELLRRTFNELYNNPKAE